MHFLAGQKIKRTGADQIPQTQWNKRKQTKEESQRAKKAKLDPDSVMSAADMRREQQKTLGAIEDGLERSVSEGDEEGRVAPIAMKKKKPKKNEFAKEAKAVAGAGAKKDTRSKSENDRYAAPGDGEEAEGESEDDGEAEEIELKGFNFSTHLTVSPSQPPSKLNPADTLKPPPTISAEQRADQRARLAARIEALRAKRRADSPDGAPARNRHELMAARRREEAVQRKERKREIRSHQKAASEQTKDVTLSPKKNETNSQSQASREENPPKGKYTGNVYPPPNHERGRKGGKEGMSKKPNSKKSRPGFEGSLKSSKRKR